MNEIKQVSCPDNVKPGEPFGLQIEYESDEDVSATVMADPASAFHIEPKSVLLPKAPSGNVQTVPATVARKEQSDKIEPKSVVLRKAPSGGVQTVSATVTRKEQSDKKCTIIVKLKLEESFRVASTVVA